jgi:hypothetical protein
LLREIVCFRQGRLPWVRIRPRFPDLCERDPGERLVGLKFSVSLWRYAMGEHEKKNMAHATH